MPTLRQAYTHAHRLFAGQPAQLSLQLGLAAALCWWWGRNLDWRQVAALMSPRHAGWLAAGLALALAGSLLRAWRWQLVVGRHARLPILRAFWINEGANLANAVIPARVGDLLRMFWLRRWHRFTAGGGAGMVMADHAAELGVATLLLCAGAVAYLVAHGAGAATLALGADAVAAVVLLALLLATVVLVPRLVRGTAVQRRVPARAGAWLTRHAAHFVDASPIRLSAGRGAALALVTLAAFAADALMLWSIFGSLGVSLPVLASLGVCLALVPGYAIPSPGGLGAVEVIGTFAAQAGGGLGRSAAAAGVLAFHGAGLLLTAATGTVALLLLGLPARRGDTG